MSNEEPGVVPDLGQEQPLVSEDKDRTKVEKPTKREPDWVEHPERPTPREQKEKKYRDDKSSGNGHK